MTKDEQITFVYDDAFDSIVTSCEPVCLVGKFGMHWIASLYGDLPEDEYYGMTPDEAVRKCRNAQYDDTIE